MVPSKQSLFALLLFGIVAVHGLSQIRFANTQQGFYSYLGLATYPNGPISGLQLENFGQLPLTDYVSLPISGSATITFYVHDFTTGEDSAFVNVTLLENRSYTFVAAGSTVPLTLFSVEERIPYGSLYAGKAVLTLINALDSTLGSPFTLVVSDGYGSSYPQVPFGTSGDLVLNSTNVDVFAYINNYYYDLAWNLFLQPDATTYLYLRGINGSTAVASSFVIPFSETNPEVPAVQPVASPVGDSAPVSAQQTARIRLINGAYIPNTRITAVMRTNSVQNATSVATSALEYYDYIFGEYITVPSSIPVSFFIDGYDLQYTVVLPTDSLSSLVFYNSNNTYTLLYLNETPVRASYPVNPNNVMYRVVNLRQGDTLSVYSGWYDYIGAVNFGSFSDFVVDNITVRGSDYHGGYVPRGQYDVLTTVYVVGRVNQYFNSFNDQTPLPPPINNAPVCVNGYVETTGYCNCYSGFADDIYNSNAKCTEGSPYWCNWRYSNTSTNPTDTGAVPSVNNLYVASGKLGFSVVSAFYSNRRTLIELPNSSCNLINNPDYYYKSTSNCVDQYFALLPFTTCGFTKSSTSDADTYRAQVHVKHIDTITVNDRTVDRVIDTPFTIVIRLPKNIAIEASVEVIAAPVYTVPLTASLVAQQVNTATQTAKLVYIASVPAQFYVQSAYVQQRPYGVNTTLSVSTTNCTSNYCVQYLTVDVNINNCEISGFYSFDVTISCRNQQNCPTDVQEAPVRATIASNILAQRSCGDASVDVGLQGSLNAYDSISFNNQALSFGPEQPAYFLVNTYSSEVSISQVTLDQVYYQGPNVAGHFLLTNGANVSSRAVHNNFTWGQLSSSQLWFSFDVTVSKLMSSEDTMFKLDNGQRGVYSFIAVVDVEWLLEGTPTAGTPITLPVPASVPSSNNNSPYSFKKRMTLQGTVSQGSQFTAQVQVAGPSSVQSGSPQSDDGAVSAGTNITALFSLCGALLVLLQL